eukprot:bmy_21442T0
MAVAEMLMDPVQTLCFHQAQDPIFSARLYRTVPFLTTDGEEWGLLDEAQRHLYHAVMTENFALVTSLGCWHGAQDEEAPSEQSVSVGMSEVGTPKPDPSTKKAQPYEMCDPLSKDLLHLPEHDGMYPDEGLYICGANLFQQQKEQIRDKLSRRDEGQPSFLTNSSIHSAERTLTCSRDGKDFPGSTGLLQQPAPHSAGKPHRDTECGEAFASGQSDYSSPLVRHRVHTRRRPSKYNGWKSSGETPTALNIYFTMEKGLSVANMGICSAKTPTSFSTKKFTPERTYEF